MFWLGMTVAMILAQSLQWWKEWGFRITVISSLVANLVVGILSGTRRRSAPRWRWALLGEVAKFLVWLAYQVVEAATTSALGKLSLCGSDASEQEKLVVAFWAPFFLLHLGGPDNLTAYALEDNKISRRKLLDIVSRILAVIYAIYNSTHGGGGRSWALLPAASGVMLVAGAVRYVERAKALDKANFDSMQEEAPSSSSSSVHSKKSSSSSKGQGYDFEKLECKIRRAKQSQGRSRLSDGEALLLAQDLFPVWRHALVDSSVDPASVSPRQKASEMILSEEWDWDWESMCKVAEMELSLIYEFLYTKAILAHTCYYYLIRLLSPFITATAAILFSFWLQEQQQQGIRGSFVGITYALLVITFLMDVAWLLRALGSTWAYAYFKAARRRWWCSIHRVVVRLDPLRLFGRDPVSHRRWSGTIGRYNLLHECTATTRFLRPEWWPVSMPGVDRPKELGYLCKLPPCVKKVLFQRVTKVLQQAIVTPENRQPNMYTRLDIRKYWGDKAFRCAPEDVKNKLKRPDEKKPEEKKPEEKKPDEGGLFGEEFEDDVLLWHIATCMVLLLQHRPQGQKARMQARAVKVMSEYMMFLVAVRRQMLPGLVLHSQLQATRKKLVEIRDKPEIIKFLSDDDKLGMNKKEKFAMILRQTTTQQPKPTEEQWVYQIQGNEGTQLLDRAVRLYFSLSGDKRPDAVEISAAPWSRPRLSDEMLEFIFNVWVDKLVYAAVRCSRDAHAQQLSAGGDLTTVLWMLIQHAGPFCIGEVENLYIVGPAAPPELEEKKPEKEKKPDEKKPAEERKPEEKQKPKKRKPKKKKKKPPPPPPTFWGKLGNLVNSVMGGPRRRAWLPPSSSSSSEEEEEEEEEEMMPPPPCSPVCPPYYHPSYPPVWPPCYDPSWPPVCPWYPQCPPQHERPGHELEEAREDEHQDSSSSDEDSKSKE